MLLSVTVTHDLFRGTHVSLWYIIICVPSVMFVFVKY